jgi:hypothetical protein
MSAHHVQARTVPILRGPHRPAVTVRGARSSLPGAAGIAEVAAQLGDGSGLVLAFLAGDVDAAGEDAAAAALTSWMGDRVIACTTAGCLGPDGYQRSGVVAVGLTAPDLTVRTLVVDVHEPAASTPALEDAAADAGDRPAFALLLVDGLSRREEAVAERVHSVLGGVPLVGGSAADALRFERTAVLADGRFRSDVATVTVLTTTAPFRPFRIQHHRAGPVPLVVTAASPADRLVHTLNGHPAAAEYAAATGVGIEDLDGDLFAAHPLLIRAGGGSWERSIASVSPDGGLRFLSAVERGAILRPALSATAEDAVASVDAAFDRLTTDLGELRGALVFDCILRRQEFEALGVDDRIGRMLADAGAFGFSTYGEQYDAVHVNHTLVGVAFGG